MIALQVKIIEKQPLAVRGWSRIEGAIRTRGHAEEPAVPAAHRKDLFSLPVVAAEEDRAAAPDRCGHGPGAGRDEIGHVAFFDIQQSQRAARDGEAVERDLAAVRGPGRGHEKGVAGILEAVQLAPGIAVEQDQPAAIVTGMLDGRDDRTIGRDRRGKIAAFFDDGLQRSGGEIIALDGLVALAAPARIRNLLGPDQGGAGESVGAPIHRIGPEESLLTAVGVDADEGTLVGQAVLEGDNGAVAGETGGLIDGEKTVIIPVPAADGRGILRRQFGAIPLRQFHHGGLVALDGAHAGAALESPGKAERDEGEVGGAL